MNKNEKIEKTDNTNVSEVLTKQVLHKEADEEMISSATKRALANDWKDPEFKRAKDKFKEDESNNDKSLRTFIKWMTENVSPKTLYNTVQRKLTYKELYLLGDGESTSNRKDVIEL